MLFNSIEFLFFFPIVTLVYFLLPYKFRWIHLLVASCVFYCAFIPVYILILFFTIIIDYYAGIYIERAEGKRRKWFLIISIVSNVGILAVFKYYNFFIENVNELFESLKWKMDLPLMKIVLPIGLSFHTFQAMSYTIEVYRGNFKAEKHFGIYALYVMFYPQLVAGPIERPQNVLPQFRVHHKFNPVYFHEGLRLMLWGLFKKVVIADRLAVYVDAIYDKQEAFSNLNYVVATLLFTIQIYCDFSGYSDIAIGSARTMGFKLMTNFNRPYFSLNIKDFWSRWHISLSTWFRDYLYIPMGGNRVKKWRQIVNTVTVFLVSGFWHGANWTFVIWGGIHAFFTVLQMLTSRLFKSIKTMFLFKGLAWLFTFCIVAIAWAFFRAKTVTGAFKVVAGIFALSDIPYKAVYGQNEYLVFIFILALLALMFYTEFKNDTEMKSMNKSLVKDIALGALVLFLIVSFGVFNRNSFIYFQF